MIDVVKGYVPNPDVVLPEVLGTMSPEEIQLSAYAYGVIQANKVGYKLDRKPYDMKQFRKAVGTDGVVAGFKGLRRLAGEAVYGGLEVVWIDIPGQVPRMQYYELLSTGTVAMSNHQNGNHDTIYHLAGALLATPRLRDFISNVAAAHPTIEESDHESLSLTLDRLTYDVQRFWEASRYFHPDEQRVQFLTHSLVWLNVLQGKDQDKELMRDMADEQRLAVRYLCDLELFTTK